MAMGPGAEAPSPMCATTMSYTRSLGDADPGAVALGAVHAVPTPRAVADARSHARRGAVRDPRGVGAVHVGLRAVSDVRRDQAVGRVGEGLQVHLGAVEQ